MRENEFNNRLYSERYWYNLIRRPILPQEQRHCDMTLGDEGCSDYNLSENWKQKTAVVNHVTFHPLTKTGTQLWSISMCQLRVNMVSAQ